MFAAYSKLRKDTTNWVHHSNINAHIKSIAHSDHSGGAAEAESDLRIDRAGKRACPNSGQVCRITLGVTSANESFKNTRISLRLLNMLVQTCDGRGAAQGENWFESHEIEYFSLMMFENRVVRAAADLAQ